MKNIIITGADGFVGSHTVNACLQHGVNVLAIDLPKKSKRLQANKRLTYVSCDVSNIGALDRLIETNKYDTFVHFAWRGSAGLERMDYRIQMDNAINTVELLRLAKEKGCKRFVCAGSIMEREVEAAVHKQGNQPGMAYVYGMGKHVAHCLCKSVAANEDIELVWPMITNAYGVGEYSPRFVNTTIRKIINKEPLQFTAATQNYDFVYITDVAEAFYLISNNGKPFCEYMIGSGNAKPLKDFILEMQQTLAPNVKPVFGDIPFTGTNMPIETFSIEDTQIDTGYCPKINFEEGTKMTMEWLKKQQERQ